MRSSSIQVRYLLDAPDLLCFPRETAVRLFRDFIFLILFFVLLIGWLLAWVAFHVAGGLVHLLVVIAVIALILHFIRGPRSV